METTGMKTPPGNCPNKGACIPLTGKLADLEIAVVRHDSALHRMGNDLDMLKEDLHIVRDEVRNTSAVLRERENNINWVRGVAASLIVLGITNLGAVSWWASRTSLSIETLGENIADLESRMRVTEKAQAVYHNDTYRYQNNNNRSYDQQ